MFMLTDGAVVPGSALEALRVSDIPFYLTGSRRFGMARATSDFDFFTADTPTIRPFLKALGFVVRAAPGYEPQWRDAALVAVWTHHMDRIDVQIRYNVEEFEAVCRMIEVSGSRPPLEKPQRMDYWNAMIRAVRETRRIGRM